MKYEKLIHKFMMKYFSFIMTRFVCFVMLTSCIDDKKLHLNEKVIETKLPEVTNDVSVMTLKKTAFYHEMVNNGRLSAQRSADLHFETSGIVSDIFVRNGDFVKKGDTIAILSTFRLSNKTAQVRDAMERAKLDMLDVLISQGYSIDDSTQIPPSTMQLVRTRSGYNQAIEQYRLAVYEEEHATLRAPFDGIVSDLFIKSFHTVSPAEIFCTLIDTKSFEVAFTMMENELPLVRRGDKIIVIPFALPNIQTEGKIVEINPVVDETGMVKVKASVTHNVQLFEGMKVQISVLRKLDNQLIVPKEAVVLRSGKQVVFTLVNGTAYWNFITTGFENMTSYTIIEGLKDGDVVITGGNLNLAHGTKVQVFQ
jgi:RND family efflux transporter MFP subunit